MGYGRHPLRSEDQKKKRGGGRDSLNEGADRPPGTDTKDPTEKKKKEKKKNKSRRGVDKCGETTIRKTFGDRVLLGRTAESGDICTLSRELLSKR